MSNTNETATAVVNEGWDDLVLSVKSIHGVVSKLVNIVEDLSNRLEKLEGMNKSNAE